MEIRGKVVAVLPMQSGQGKNGEWKKQEYVIEHSFDSQFPRRMMFNLWGDRIGQYQNQLQEGQMVKIDFDIDCREFNGRWYNDIRAWRVEFDNATNAAAAPQQETPPPSAPTPSYSTQDIPPADNEESDLPF